MYSKYNFSVVRTLRHRLGLTLEELAKKSGLTYPTVASIETNKTLPSMKTLDALGAALQVSASNLLALAECRMVQIRHAETLPNTTSKWQSGLDKVRVAVFDKGKLKRVQAQKGETICAIKLHEDCHEMCYVLSGTTELRITDNAYILRANDTILFDGMLDHSYTMIENCEFITVHIPKDIQVIEALLNNPHPNSDSAL